MTNPSTDRYPAPSFREPSTDRFVYAGWSVDPPRVPRVGRSSRRREAIDRIATLATDSERDPEVVGVAVYETRLIAPVPGTPRLDVLLLARATTGAAATRVVDAVRAHEPDLLMRARNTRRIGDTDAPGTGTFLFNHFSATDPATAVPAWEQAGAWFVAKMGVDNSTLLQPDDDADDADDDSYPLVNYVQAPCGPGAFLRRQLTRPSFHTHVRRLLREYGMVSFPLLARQVRAPHAAHPTQPHR